MPKFGMILIVDDDELVLEALYQSFIDEYDVVLASSGKEALQKIADEPELDAIVLDIRMAKMDGLETADRIRERVPDLPLIFNTGFPGDYSENDIDKEHHPFDYVEKSERPQRLKRAVQNAVAFHRLLTGSTDLVKFAREQYSLVGHSPVMCDVYRKIEKIGPENSKVMILGPTGSGKEMIARAIHKRSPRSGLDMVVVNCSHKSPDLVDAELFGHRRGAFTGAIADQVGMFEYADKSTLFLDEIGNLDMRTQGKLLRALESGEVKRIGAPEITHVDVRLICATNSDLEQMVEDGTFREDLYFRLKGIRIVLPALKDRRQDIPELIDYFAEEHCRSNDRDTKIFAPTARDVLVEFDWPGNVRQLQDTIHSLIDLSASYYITRDEVLAYLSFRAVSPTPNRNFHDRIDEYKRLLIVQALDKHPENVSAAARSLGMDPANFRKIIKKLNINLG